jgi:hypothetical protein
VPDSPNLAASSWPASRWLLALGLLLVLLLLGACSESILTFLTAAWPRLLAATGLSQQAQALQQGLDSGIAKRPLPVVATYAATYLLVCLVLLRVVLTRSQWGLAVRLYAGTLAVYVALVLLGKSLGHAEWAFRLSRQLLDFVISPLPVAGLYVLFRAGFGPGPKQA